MAISESEQIDHDAPGFQAPEELIRLSGDPKMGFVKDCNVNYEQRDQYKSDAVNVDTGEMTNSLTMIQGEKSAGSKFTSRLPRFRVSIPT